MIIGVLAIVSLVVWLRRRDADMPIAPVLRPDAAPVGASQDTNPSALHGVSAPIFPIDSDDDGVSDEVEREKGTDPQRSDTDEDGYGDGEELYRRKSDPLQADPPPVYPGLIAPPGGASL